eukprot:gene24151-biopygen9865
MSRRELIWIEATNPVRSARSVPKSGDGHPYQRVLTFFNGARSTDPFLNFGARAQDDFDSHLNAQWRINNPVPAAYGDWGTFHVLVY